MKKLTPKELERQLGMQYAQWVKENPQTASIYRDCQEVIQTSLAFMEHYNKAYLTIRNGLSGRTGSVSSTHPA